MAKTKTRRPFLCRFANPAEVPAWELLDRFSREELRQYAKSLGVPTGSDKRDVIRNLLDSGKVILSISLG